MGQLTFFLNPLLEKLGFMRGQLFEAIKIEHRMTKYFFEVSWTHYNFLHIL